MSKLKGSVRDKVKQVLLVEGTPDILYYERERAYTSIKINNKVYKLGSISTELADELTKVKHFEVRTVMKKRKCPVAIKLEGVGNRNHVRNVNGNTHIQVGAQDEQQLAERIERIKKYLTDNGAIVTERCHWVCSVDKKKEQEQKHNEYVEPVITSTTAVDVDKNNKTDMLPVINGMSEKTKKLRQMTIKMGLAAVYDKYDKGA